MCPYINLDELTDAIAYELFGDDLDKVMNKPKSNNHFKIKRLKAKIASLKEENKKLNDELISLRGSENNQTESETNRLKEYIQYLETRLSVLDKSYNHLKTELTKKDNLLKDIKCTIATMCESL